MRQHLEEGGALVGPEMPSVEVQAPHDVHGVPGDVACGIGDDLPAVRPEFPARPNPMDTVEDLPVVDLDRLPHAVARDVLLQRRELLVGERREELGEGMDPHIAGALD